MTSGQNHDLWSMGPSNHITCFELHISFNPVSGQNMMISDPGGVWWPLTLNSTQTVRMRFQWFWVLTKLDTLASPSQLDPPSASSCILDCPWPSFCCFRWAMALSMVTVFTKPKSCMLTRWSRMFRQRFFSMMVAVCCFTNNKQAWFIWLSAINLHGKKYANYWQKCDQALRDKLT